MPAFATSAHVQARIPSRTLTADELEAADAVIEIVTGLICDAVDRDGAWATELAAVPPALKGLCVEKALTAVASPSGVASESVGDHSITWSRTSQNGTSGIFLTPQEERLARQAVYGTLSGSSTPRALPDRIIDLNEGRDVDEVEA